MDPLTILAALGPLAVDLGKSLIARFIAPDVFKPANVGEYLQMRSQDLAMFQAMNASGGSASYPWVEAIVRLQRPAVGAVVLATWAYVTLDPAIAVGTREAVNNFAGAVGFYLFGDRTLFYSRKAAK